MSRISTDDASRASSPVSRAVPIGEAARLAGVTRATLRVWERERLISPQRTPGGHRLYTPDDVQRLRAIAHLRRIEQLNAAAIRRELGPAAAGTAPATDVQGGLGPRLRSLRRAHGWSLAEVAARAGLSVSFLSAVERGQSSISVGNLFKLADAFGTTVPGLSGEGLVDGRRMLHPGERPCYRADRGLVLIEDLISTSGALEAQRIEICQGGGSEEAYAHPGEEFIYVLAGRLIFQIDAEEPYRLEEGDTLYFPSLRLHRWWNDGDGSTTVLWINVPLVAPFGAVPVTGRRGAVAMHRPAERPRVVRRKRARSCPGRVKGRASCGAAARRGEGDQRGR